MKNIPEELILEQFMIGPMGNFAYFIGCKETKKIAVVDPGWEADAIKKKADELDYEIESVLLTHGHYDHTGALTDLIGLVGDVPVYLSSNGKTKDSLSVKNLSLVENNGKIKIGKVEIEGIHTPGHSPGSICYRYKNVLITGDTLFINGCGRCDLGGGNVKDMYNSLYNVIMKLPDDTLIFSGHDYGHVPYDTLVNQKKTNHFLTCPSEKEFVKGRM